MTDRIEEKKGKDKAYIIFTKVPERCKVKTRMKPFYDDDQCLELQRALIRDGLRRAGRLMEKEVALFFAWSGEPSHLEELEAMAGEAGIETMFFPREEMAWGSGWTTPSEKCWQWDTVNAS